MWVYAHTHTHTHTYPHTFTNILTVKDDKNHEYTTVSHNTDFLFRIFVEELLRSELAAYRNKIQLKYSHKVIYSFI